MPKPKQIDKTLLYTVLTLLVFGLVMIASAGIAYSRSRFGDPYYFFKHQLLFGVLPGLVVLYAVSKIEYVFWKKISFAFFAVALLFLVLVFIPGLGNKIYGASRWLQLGSFSFQPSEMMKLAIIIYLSAWLEKREHKIKDFYEGLMPFIVVIGLVSFLRKNL